MNKWYTSWWLLEDHLYSATNSGYCQPLDSRSPPTPLSSTLRYITPILQEVRSHKAVAWFRLCNFKIISLITRILLFWMLVKSLGDHTINITSSIISVEASCVVWSLWLKPALCNHKSVVEFLQFQPCLAQGGGPNCAPPVTYLRISV